MTEIKWISDYENENKYLTLRILEISDFENIKKFLTLNILKISDFENIKNYIFIFHDHHSPLFIGRGLIQFFTTT